MVLGVVPELVQGDRLGQVKPKMPRLSCHLPTQILESEEPVAIPMKDGSGSLKVSNSEKKFVLRR